MIVIVNAELFGFQRYCFSMWLKVKTMELLERKLHMYLHLEFVRRVAKIY